MLAYAISRGIIFNNPAAAIEARYIAQASSRDVSLTAEWRIPAERMKMDKAHIVPLSSQALAMFEELKFLAGSSFVALCVPQP